MKTPLPRLFTAATLLLVIASAGLPVRAEDDGDSSLRIHYHRYDGNYDAATMWTWDLSGNRQPENNELEPAGSDDYGPFFEIDTALYGAEGEAKEIGFLIRFNRNWDQKDGGDRVWREHMGNEIYLKGGDMEIYREKPDTSPKVLKAFYDASDKLTLFLSARAPDGVSADDVDITDDSGRSYSVTGVSVKNGNQMSVTLGERLPFETKVVTVSVGDLAATTVAPRHVLEDPHTYYDADVKLGANWTAEATTFRVFAPTASKAWVVLNPSYTGDERENRVEMSKGKAGVWSVTVEGDLHGTWYHYSFEGNRLDPENEALDPYARVTSNRYNRGMVVNLRATDPEGFRPIKRPPMSSPNNAVIWEIHVRDFSIAANSGMENKGRYLAFTEAGTTIPGTDVKTGLDHIKELGVTHVQLLPVQDFDNNEEDWDQYNWGYMPSHFNSPDGWFATQVYGPERVTELKQAIKALHDNGVRVIMDVVYNHTDNSAPFNALVPDYYYRVTDDGSFWNGAGTGNEFNTEAPMARKFIVDSCKFWVEEYGVDGFRFDLMGLIDMKTMQEVRHAVESVDPTILVYGEPWTAAATKLAQPTYKDQVRGSGLGAFNDHIRNAIKGDTRGPGQGFVQAGIDIDRLKQGLQGSINDWAGEPTEPINYVSAHDDNTQWDKLLISADGVTDAEREQMQAMSIALTLFAQGKAFLHGGVELCRTKDGVENSYNYPDSINQIDWSWKQDHAQVFEYTRDLIALRNAHPMFHMTTRGEVARRITFPATTFAKTVIHDIDARGVAGESWDLVRIVYNANADAIDAPLGPGEWTVAVSGWDVDTDGLATASGTVSVPGRSTVLVYQ